MGRGGGEVGLSGTAAGQHRVLGAEPDQNKLVKLAKNFSRFGVATEGRITEDRITEDRITEGRITEGRIHCGLND